MGRHSSPEQGHFYRSFFGWVGLWTMIALVTGIGVWFIVGAIGGPDATRSIASEARGSSNEVAGSQQDPAPTVSGALITSEPQTPTPEAVATPTPIPTNESDRDAKLITAGISVQVLNATAAPGTAQSVADKLSGLGFTVVAVEESSRLYEETTVFWSTDESRDAAVALAERFGWVSDAKPANLSDGVSIHVVAGADEV